MDRGKLLQKIKKYPEFYQKVWLKTCEIPYGETRTYKWVAEEINHKKAYRAVGNALHNNPFIGIIPCHRVIKENGDLGGFAKGKKKKLQLLREEEINV